jgi:hypothetical protein
MALEPGTRMSAAHFTIDILVTANLAAIVVPPTSLDPDLIRKATRTQLVQACL